MKITQGFTIIELMVAILIFTVGLLSAFMLVDSAMSMAINGQNEITATNLAREQIELLKNLRDSNWLQQRDWRSLINADSVMGALGYSESSRFSSGIYIIENSLAAQKPILIKQVPGFVWQQGRSYKPNELQSFAYCIKNGKYTRICDSNDKKTQFYGFLQIEELKTPKDNNVIDNAFRITSVILTTQRGYREYVVRTILTDWKDKKVF